MYPEAGQSQRDPPRNRSGHQGVETDEDYAEGGDARRKFAIGVGEIFFSPEIADGLLFFQTGRAHDAVTGAESLPLLNRPRALLPSSRSFTIKNVLSLVIETEADWPRGS